LTLAELRARCYDELAEDESSPSRYPATDVREYLNDAVAEYTARVGHNIVTSTLTQTASQFWYDLPADCIQIRRISRDASTGATNKMLQPVNSRLLDYVWGRNSRWGSDTDVRARDYMPFSYNEVALYPQISTGTDTYTLTYRKDSGYADMVDDTDEPSVPDEDHDALVLYAVARCLLIDSKVNDAAMKMATWRARLREAKRNRSSADRMWQDDIRGSL
jgi:hypothetical protein